MRKLFTLTVDGYRTDTLQVAEYFGKHHRHITSKIDELPNSEFVRSNFIISDYKAKSKRTHRVYNLTPNGFLMLVMSFTGRYSHTWKTEVIELNNELMRRNYD